MVLSASFRPVDDVVAEYRTQLQRNRWMTGPRLSHLAFNTWGTDPLDTKRYTWPMYLAVPPVVLQTRFVSTNCASRSVGHSSLERAFELTKQTVCRADKCPELTNVEALFPCRATDEWDLGARQLARESEKRHFGIEAESTWYSSLQSRTIGSAYAELFDVSCFFELPLAGLPV